MNFTLLDVFIMIGPLIAFTISMIRKEITFIKAKDDKG